MKISAARPILVFTSFLLMTVMAAAARADQSNSRVLIFGQTIRPAHATILPVAGAALAHLFNENGFQATFVNDIATFHQIALQNYRVLVLLDVSENVLGARSHQEIENFFRAGNGLIAVHASVAAAKDWPWFQDLIGVTYRGHAPLQNGKVQATIFGRALSPALPSEWQQVDEWYSFAPMISKDNQILFTVDEHSIHGENMLGPHPVVWLREVGRGRFFYTALGHSAELYANSENPFSKMLIAAVHWAARE